MSLNIGNAHKIAAMASKSCNAVGKRDLYVPLSAEYIVNGRDYIITVTLYCFFGTRININNTFTDINIGGHSLQNVVVDGWVNKNTPGKEITSTTITGHFNADGTPENSHYTIPVSGNMIYFSDVMCRTTKSIPFSNYVEIDIDNIEPSYTAPAVPTASLSLATDSRLVFNLETTSFGEGGGKFLYAELSKTNFGSVIRTTDVLNVLAGDAFAVNLQRNTRYYAKAVAANNGMASSATPIEAVTLAASEITAVAPISSGARVDLIIYNGGGHYQPTTTIESSTDLETWEQVASTTSKTTYSANIGLSTATAGTTYYFRTRTETTAGVFYSNHVQFTVPGNIYGNITRIDSEDTYASVSYAATASGGGNISATFYYRIVGLEEDWIECATATIQSGTVNSFIISGLQPNYFEYEVSANFKKGAEEYDCEPVSFHTIPSVVSNENCDALNYLTQLICQELEEIKRGNITVFMNDDTKKWCEDETDDTPTLSSMLSRVNRFMHAVGCVLCSMEGFIELLKDSNSNQVFMGKLGWVDVEDEIIDGSLSPVFSGAVFTAIDELVHKVWHYTGAYDFYGSSLADLNEQTGSSGDTGIVGNKVYHWSSGAWRNPETITPENFGVIHINDGVYAGNGYYWFVDGWNRLDLDDKEIQRRLAALEGLLPVSSYDGEDYKMAVIGSDDDIYIDVPTDVTKDTVVLITEDVREPVRAQPHIFYCTTNSGTVNSISIDANTLVNTQRDWFTVGSVYLLDVSLANSYEINFIPAPGSSGGSKTWSGFSSFNDALSELSAIGIDITTSSSTRDVEAIFIVSERINNIDVVPMYTEGGWSYSLDKSVLNGVDSVASGDVLLFTADSYGDYEILKNGNVVWSGATLDEAKAKYAEYGVSILDTDSPGIIQFGVIIWEKVEPPHWGILSYNDGAQKTYKIKTEADFNKLCNGTSMLEHGAYEFSDGTVVAKGFVHGYSFGQLAPDEIGDNFLAECVYLNSDIKMPDNVTSIGDNFMHFCRNFNSALELSASLEEIGDEFLTDCTTFNQPITLPNSLTTIGSHFMDGDSDFNSALILSSSLVSIGDSFMLTCTKYNQPLTLPQGLRTIGFNALNFCKAFNQELIIPTSVTSIGYGFMTNCHNFNHPLTIPSSVTSVGDTHFMNNCRNFIGPLTVNMSNPPRSGDAASLATDSQSDPMYATGVTLKGSGATAWKNALPDRSSSSTYRKLILGAN